MIKSLIDTDLYKLTMQQAILELFPYTQVEYRFTNRGEQRFDKKFLECLNHQLSKFKDIELEHYEYLWLKDNIPYLKPHYLEYLKNYRYNPSEVAVKLTSDNDLDIKIKGDWISTILWEVPLMALISEIYFNLHTDWTSKNQESNLFSKIDKMTQNDCKFAEFGTRRRRNYKTQKLVNSIFKRYQEKNQTSCFVGSSNVHFAQKYNLKPIGTYAHEWVMGNSVLESLNHQNYFAMQNWVKVYNCSLGIALSDTITTEMFLKNFNKRFAMMFNGTRHDSGCPFKYTEKIIQHYKKLDINPLTKTIIFSDGLDIDKCLEINDYCKDKINCSFGIGTNLTNDFKDNGYRDIKPLNMVIKLYSVDNVPVVKLSDVQGKETGDKKALSNMKWIVNNFKEGIEK